MGHERLAASRYPTGGLVHLSTHKESFISYVIFKYLIYTISSGQSKTFIQSNLFWRLRPAPGNRRRRLSGATPNTESSIDRLALYKDE